MHSYLKFLLGIILFLAFGYLFYHYLTTLFLPFFIALILAYSIEPLVRFLEVKARLKREFAVGIAVLTMISLTILLMTYLVLRIYSELVSLSNIMPYYYHQVNNNITNLLHNLEKFYLDLPNPVIELIQNNISKLYQVFEKLLTAVISPIAALPSFFTIILIAAVATYFISKDKEMIKKFMLRLLPLDWQVGVKKAHQEVIVSIVSFLKAQMILISITMVATIIGLTIIGVDYALLIGILTGFLDILPILGPTTLFVPWIAYLFVMGQYSLGISLLILYATLLIVRQICEPKIVAQAIGVHPLSSLMAMYIGLKLLGMMGVILGPLTLITLKAVIKAGLIPNLPKE